MDQAFPDARSVGTMEKEGRRKTPDRVRETERGGSLVPFSLPDPARRQRFEIIPADQEPGAGQ